MKILSHKHCAYGKDYRVATLSELYLNCLKRLILKLEVLKILKIQNWRDRRIYYPITLTCTVAPLLKVNKANEQWKAEKLKILEKISNLSLI